MEVNVPDKLAVVDEWRKEMGLCWKEVAYLGNEVSDEECLKKVGLSGVPADACAAAQKAVGYICKAVEAEVPSESLQSTFSYSWKRLSIHAKNRK